MEVKVKANNNKTNPQNPQPQNSQTNPINKSQTQNSQLNINNLNNLSLDQLYQFLQLLQQQQKQAQSQSQSNEFIVKSGMKASVVAIRVEQMLLSTKNIKISALGYAIPVLIDSLFLVKKDMAKINKSVDINLELFEKEVTSSFGKKRVISGVRAILTLI